jgi:hypothetical protein
MALTHDYEAEISHLNLEKNKLLDELEFCTKDCEDLNK